VPWCERYTPSKNEQQSVPANSAQGSNQQHPVHQKSAESNRRAMRNYSTQTLSSYSTNHVPDFANPVLQVLPLCSPQLHGITRIRIDTNPLSLLTGTLVELARAPSPFLGRETPISTAIKISLSALLLNVFIFTDNWQSGFVIDFLAS
jgi:hypothetical protein